MTISIGFALSPHDAPRFKRPAGKYLSEDECEAAGRALFDQANEAVLEVKRQGGDDVLGVHKLKDL